jgi:hypothetical protein
MKRTVDALFAALVAALVSCTPGAPSEVHWKDGNFKIYATDTDFNATELGYDHHPGLLGLVDTEVVAAGSTAQCVFVERTDPASKRTEFFIVLKEASSETHSGEVEGPYTTAQFQEIRTARKLPEFTWRKKKKG